MVRLVIMVHGHLCVVCRNGSEACSSGAAGRVVVVLTEQKDLAFASEPAAATLALAQGRLEVVLATVQRHRGRR